MYHGDWEESRSKDSGIRNGAVTAAGSDGAREVSNYEERKRKRTAREGHDASERAQNLRGLRAKLYAAKRHKEKIQMKKSIRAHEQRNVTTPSTRRLLNLCHNTFSTVRIPQRLKRSHRRSRASGRRRRPSSACRCPRYEASVKRRCSRL
ncbi:hypothetical protein MRB53_036950 [Persea americana]|nr:hypothetical protein MRB53_036950 [Persea americana]